METIKAVKNGDEKVFSEIFDTLHGKVFGFFMRRTNNDREASKELAQLTYIKLWQSKHTLSLSHPLEKQLFIIAKYTLIDYIRREAKADKSKDAVAKTIVPESLYSEFSSTVFESKDYVIAKLKQLPPTRKKILQMKVLNGYSNKEIASLLSISINTVEDHITKGLNELRTTTALSVPFILFFLLDHPL